MGWSILRAAWKHVVAYAEEIMWAAIFAIIFGIIVDLFTVGSRIRGVVRLAKNKWSEQSVARLRKRIVELRVYRDSLASYLSSDKTHYLNTLRLIIVILLGMCLTAFLLIVDRLGLAPPGMSRSYTIMALVPLAATIVIGLQAVRIASLDTGMKVSEMIAKLDGEIADLKSKLQVRIESLSK